MFSVSDLLQPERPDPDPVSDHGRRHARAGAHPGRGGGAQGRLQHQGDSGEQEQMQVSQGFRLSSTYDINVQTYLQGWSDISAGWRPGEVRGGGGQIHRSVPGGTAAVRDAVHRTVQVTLIISTHCHQLFSWADCGTAPRWVTPAASATSSQPRLQTLSSSQPTW